MIDYGRFTLLRGRWYARALLVFIVFAFTLFVDCEKCLKGDVLLKGDETKVLGPYDKEDIAGTNRSCGWSVQLNYNGSALTDPSKCSFESVELLSLAIGDPSTSTCTFSGKDIRCSCTGAECNKDLHSFPMILVDYAISLASQDGKFGLADYNKARCFSEAFKRKYAKGLFLMAEFGEEDEISKISEFLMEFKTSNLPILKKEMQNLTKSIYDESLTTSTMEAPTTSTSSETTANLAEEEERRKASATTEEPTTEAPEEAGFDFADWFVNGNLGSLSTWIYGMAPIILIPILFNMAGYRICPVFIHKSTFSLGKSPFFDDGMPAPMDDVTVTSAGDLTIQKPGREKAGGDVEAPKEPTPAEAAAAAKKASHKASRKAAKAAKKEAATTSGASATADASKETASSDVSKAAASADAAKAAPAEVPAQGGKIVVPVTRESVLKNYKWKPGPYDPKNVGRKETVYSEEMKPNMDIMTKGRLRVMDGIPEPDLKENNKLMLRLATMMADPTTALPAAEAAKRKDKRVKLDESLPIVSNGQEFNIKRWVGSGTYGDVYLVTKKGKPDETFAMKVENLPPSAGHPKYRLAMEARIMMELTLKGTDPTGKFTNCLMPFPIAMACGVTNGYTFLIMECLGKSLDKLVSELPLHEFHEDIAQFIAMELWKAVQWMSSYGIVHRDLKPANIAINYDNSIIKILDFGMARKYRRDDGMYCRQRMNMPCLGTTRYQSVAAAKGMDQSNKDDMEAVLYIWAELTSHECLPWRGGKITLQQMITKKTNWLMGEGVKDSDRLHPAIFGIGRYLSSLLYASPVDYDIIEYFMTYFDDVDAWYYDYWAAKPRLWEWMPGYQDCYGKMTSK